MSEKKIAIITGGESGIGLSTVKKLLEIGYKVYSCDVTQKENLAGVSYIKVDVTDSESCKNAFDQVISNEGRIDALVTCAGITRDALTCKMTDEQFDSVINVNIKGTYNIVRYVGPFMEKQGFGSIVTISSVVGEQGNIGQINYSATKGAVISMTKTWAKEFARKGANVRVNSVAPGYTKTQMLSSVPEDLLEKFASQTYLKRLAEPEEIASAIRFLVSDESSYITGITLSVNGGLRL